MDLATILGIIGGFSLVIVAMASGGGLAWFLDGPSAMIVLGGTFGAVLINYPLSDMLGVIKVAKNVFLKREQKVGTVIRLLVEMSRVSRRDGLLALQQMTRRVRDPFLIKAVDLMIDGIEPEDISNILETEIDFLAERHRLGAEIFNTMGNFAPAMGMMGTLIGLVQMLMQMSNPNAIGPAMAVALITTFYGVILANLVFVPIAGKLKTRSAQELLVKQLIVDGVLSIHAGDNPRVLEQKLHSFISPNERKSVFQSGGTEKK
ncbi:MAG: MotA/TolQ/ExbB proton channel family protein [Deltaproteobacteria bacterium]|nr:MotA/TolQ/ExbB proton channel family protein [Deltaproteobacteria bacterium]